VLLGRGAFFPQGGLVVRAHLSCRRTVALN
jgi:hypothetical protein